MPEVIKLLRKMRMKINLKKYSIILKRSVLIQMSI